jgi:branched-chain amino acid transport system substrate-binding protein
MPASAKRKYRLLGAEALKGVVASAQSAPPGLESRVVVKDIGDSAKGLTTALEELLRTPGLTFIVDPAPSKFIGSVSTRISSERIPTLEFPISEDENTGGPYIIKFYYPLEEQAKVISRYAARELGLRTFAVLYPKTELGISMKKVFASGVEEYGGRLVYEGSYDP